MPSKLIDLYTDLDDLLSGDTSLLPVLVRSSNTGTVFTVGEPVLAVVTDEMVLTGCKLPVGTRVLLFHTD